MSSNPEPSSQHVSATQQRRQANRLLLRLQWLVMLLLILALIWLYISQQRFQNNINERLQSNEQIISRLNEMDDRLFAMNQQNLPEPNLTRNNQAQNQLDLLRIQIQAVDRLLADNNDSAAIDLLRGLHWQLSQTSNEIAPAVTMMIKQSLMKDIERLQAQSTQISPWQAQNLAIQNIQEFLHNHERNLNTNSTSQQNKSAQSTLAHSEETLTRRQLVIHEAVMTLNLASQASNMREQDQLLSYLSQARKQLQTLLPKINANTAIKDQNASLDNLQTMAAPKNVSEVIHWLDELIANAPTTTPLLTTQILEQPKPQ